MNESEKRLDTANGSSLTESANITGYTTTNWNLYRIEWDPGSEARFYINGTLEATITTTLPSVANPIKFGCGCSAAVRYGLGSPVVSVEI